jgi:hypothetical protein
LASYFTRSAKLKACSGWLARLDTSSSAIVIELGGCDHFCADGDGCRATLASREMDLDTEDQLGMPFLCRRGRERIFMVALGDVVWCGTVVGEAFDHPQVLYVRELIVKLNYWNHPNYVITHT